MSEKILIYEKMNNISGMTHEKSDDGFMRLTGVFGVCGVRNNNKRIYEKNNYRAMVEEMRQRIATEGCPGELEHPTTMNIDYNNVSHVIEDINIDDQGVVTGTIKLLNTPKGKIAQALVEGGLPLFVSSRAQGNVDKNGHVQLEMLKTYDLVGTPGFSQARLKLNESLVVESVDDDMFIVHQPEPAPAPETIEENNNTNTNMTKEEIKQMLIDEVAPLLESWMEQRLADSKPAEKDHKETIKAVSEALLPKIESWIREEYTQHLADSIEKWVTEEYGEHIADRIEKWINEEYSPELEKWIVQEHDSALGESIERWITEEYAPNNTPVTESKEDKLNTIDAILEMLEKDSEKPTYSRVNENAETTEPLFIRNMPEALRPLWEAADADTRDYITRKAKLYNLQSQEQITDFWENKVDFSAATVKPVTENLDTCTNTYEKNLRESLRSFRARK